jgi:hypothetical protein
MNSDKKGDRIGAGKGNEALDPKAGNASQRDRIETATAAQGSVSPEDYPAMERDAQVAAATGKPRKRG